MQKSEGFFQVDLCPSLRDSSFDKLNNSWANRIDNALFKHLKFLDKSKHDVETRQTSMKIKLSRVITLKLNSEAIDNYYFHI